MFPYITIGTLTLPTYGVMIASGILISGLLAFVRVKKAGLSVDDFLMIAACAIGLGLFGAWLTYVLVSFSVAEIVAIIRAGQIGLLLQGGMVFYGGFIGGVLGALLGARIAGAPLTDFLNPVVPVLPLAHAIGRIGCFCAGCCYGVPTNSALGVVYTHPVGGAPVGVALLPVQLFETGCNLLIFLFLIVFTKKTKSKTLVLPAYVICYGCVRFCLEYIRYDFVRGALLGLSTSQWFSIGGVLLSVAYIVYHRRREKKRSSACT
ncbi:MAG TPA: prolipoprotein diacylglyceryl transferase [Eubacteriales bacterium]|nr:prolipoprotein diacylglyceryl transferase [Eubacteriales bacterium]